VHDLHALLGPTRVTSAADLSAVVSGRTVARWLAAGRLVRLHPGWVTAAEFAEDWTVRAHGATSYAGGPLSHMSALAVHGVVDREVTRLSVTVPSDRRGRTSRWLRVHRSRNPLKVVRARGLPTTTIARSLVDTWSDAHRTRAARRYGEVARGAVLRATRERRVSGRELSGEAALRPELAGRAALMDLIGLIAAGSQSELEIFGVRHVLAVPGLPPFRQQHRVDLPDGPVLLDAAWPEVKLAIEFDGAAFHGSQEARERDLRRDAALAAQGWLVLRFSYRRLTRHPDACRAQIAATYASRLTVVR
jgi:very-short-patch-repair endonuclease